MPDTQEKTQIDQTTSLDIEIRSGALVGLGIIAIVQMLSVTSLDVPLKVSLCSFAVSIPFLSSAFLCVRKEAKVKFTSTSKSLALLVVLGNIASFAGVSGLFFHFTNYVGIIFIVGSLIGFVVALKYFEHVRRT